MGYTATQMYQLFNQLNNEAGNDTVLAYEVERYLNSAQYQLYDEQVYPRAKMLAQGGQTPQIILEENIYSSEWISPFNRKIESTSMVTGYIPKPQDYEFITALGVFKNPEDCVAGEEPVRYPVKFMRKDEMWTYEQNSFLKPIWEPSDYPQYAWHRVYFTEETASNGQVIGLQLYPQRQYSYRLDYLTRPRPIQIKSPSNESAYFGMANYILRAEDQNCEFLESQQNEIIRRALLLFNASVRNPEDASMDGNMVKEGFN